ncbi:MAG TPA: replication-relaxation family protein [Mycobacteriales bacterium]|nr:replication-relaxation family protein [Mycobacteriales bacterium]
MRRYVEDVAILRAVWSFGCLTRRQIAGLAGFTEQTAQSRVHPLWVAGALRRDRPRYHGPYLYRIGPAVDTIAAELGHGWHPRPGQIQHTMLTADLVVALLRRCSVPVTGWAGEAELRTMATAGEPRPDAALTWRFGEASGRWLLEADRGTENHQIWRRKLYGYRGLRPDEVVLVGAPNRHRAGRIAAAANQANVALLAAVSADLLAGGDPIVYDARVHRRRPLTEASTGIVAKV